MREIARHLMKTDWAQNALKEPLIREALEEWTIDSLRRSLKPEGKPRFDDFVNSLKRGEKIVLSNYMDMFLGYDFKSGIEGLESLTLLKEKPILVVANHINKGPMRGDWQHAAISHYVKKTTQKEVRWLHGFDPTTTQDLFRERSHQLANNIPIRGPDTQKAARLLIQAIKNNDSMGLYPEGDGSRNLRKGLPEAGRLIAICARNSMNIVSCSVRFQRDTFFLTFDNIDSEKIKALEQKGKDRNAGWQNITDYAMTNIAKHLPENRRGYYGESQKTNGVELTLTTPSMILNPSSPAQRIIDKWTKKQRNKAK